MAQFTTVLSAKLSKRPSKRLGKELRKKLRKRLLASAGALGVATLALAGVTPAEDAANAAPAPVSAEVEKVLREKFANLERGLEIDSVAPSELPGMYRVQISQGPILYATGDGAYFILGDLYGVGAASFVNLTERQRSENRRLALADAIDTIVFPAEGQARAHVTVFTDVSCFYCQKFHREVPELNRRGVEVRYLAYPREGIDSDGFRQLASAWCADDRRSTLTRLKNRETLPDNVCPGNPVAQQFELGQQLGVRGTPAIVTPLGDMIPGYRSADDLVALLGVD